MSHASSGGIANWLGASFELRLAVDYCVSALLDEDAALGPGAIASIQLQAPGHAEPVDDLVVCFESGDKWAVQAKAGSSAGVTFNPNRPFGKALRQLYAGAAGGQVDLSLASLDRLILAVDHQAPASVTAFGEWLAKARYHMNWQGFARASQVSADERRFLAEVPAFLGVPPGDELLHFLHHCWIQRAPPPDQWAEDLGRRLKMAGVPDLETARAILAVLVNEIQGGAPYSAEHSPASLRRACQEAGITDLPRAPARAFRLFEEFTEDDLYRALDMPPLRVDRFVERPELAPALACDRGALIAGQPGIGKSHGLIKLALAQPGRAAVIVARTFGPDDIPRLTGRLRRLRRPYQLIWDNIHEKPELFAQTLEHLSELGEPARILAAYRDHAESEVRKQITPDRCRRAGLPAEPLRLRPFDAGQAAEMTDAVADALDLAMDEEARRQLARHIVKADGGPFFAISTGKLLGQKTGGRVRAGDVGGLPEDLLAIWRWLYESLADHPQGVPMQSVLHCARFLHQVGCPLNARLMALLATQVEGMSQAEFRGASEQLGRAGWLSQAGEAYAAHDVTLEAIPGDEERFHEFAQWAHQGMQGEDLALGLLRGSISLFYWQKIPRTRARDERLWATASAVDYGELAVSNFRVIGHIEYLATVLSNTSNAHSDLAALQTSRQERAQALQHAIDYIEEAIQLYRALGLQADVAMSLNNASSFYSDLAALQTSRQERAQALQHAIDYIEEALTIRRALGLQAEVATSLNNASNRYSDLAALQTSRQERAQALQHAIDYIEEAIQLYRALGLQADVAMSLNNASSFYSDLAALQTSRQERAQALQHAIDYIEEALTIRRALGLQAEVATSLNNASSFYSDLAALQTSRQERAQALQHAIDYIEEALTIRRALGLQADVAMSLNNASNRYSDLAALQTSRQERAQALQHAIDYIEEALTIRRALGLQAEVATSLNNASSFYSDLAALQAQGRQERAQALQHAIDYIEEALTIRRALGLQANVAMSLNNASNIFRGMAQETEEVEAQIKWLEKGLACIEEAVGTFRAQGIIPHLLVALTNAVITHWMLAERTGRIARDHVLALCREGAGLAARMEDQPRQDFFQEIQGNLT